MATTTALRYRDVTHDAVLQRPLQRDTGELSVSWEFAPLRASSQSLCSSSGIRLPFTMATAIMDPNTVSREVIVGLEEGLHLTPMRALTLLAEQFTCEISIHKGDRVVDAKSMLDLMTLMAEHGTPLLLTARGPDATAAIEALGNLFDNDFRPSDRN